MTRQFWMGFLACYLMGAIFFGVSIQRMPAVNWAGSFYYGALWPLTPLSVALDTDLFPIPAWAFTFDEGDEA